MGFRADFCLATTIPTYSKAIFDSTSALSFDLPGAPVMVGRLGGFGSEDPWGGLAKGHNDVAWKLTVGP